MISEWEEHAKKLQVEKERTEEQLSAAEHKVAEQEKLLADWEEQAVGLEKDVKRLESELEAATAKAQEMEQALDEVLDEHDEVSIAQREMVEHHEAEKREWEEERDDLNARLVELKQQVADLQVDKNTIQLLEEAVSDWKEKVVKAATERDVALEKISELEGRLSVFQSIEIQAEDLQRLKEENEQLQKLRETHGAEIDVWQRKSERQESELALAIESRDEERQQAVSRIEFLEEENNQLRTVRDELQAELDDFKSRTTKVDKQKYDRLLAEKDRLAEVNEDQRKQLSEWATKVENLEDSWFRRIEHLRSELKNMERAKDDEKEETRRLRKLLEEERDVWDREVKDLKAEREELENTRDNLKIQLKEILNGEVPE